MADSAAAPDAQASQFTADPLVQHLLRRAKFFENEALMLAVALKDCVAQLSAPTAETPTAKDDD
jgi:hypothetical protein